MNIEHNGKLPASFQSWEQLYESTASFGNGLIHVPLIVPSMLVLGYKTEPDNADINTVSFDMEYIARMYEKEVFKEHLRTKDFRLTIDEVSALFHTLDNLIGYSDSRYKIKDKIESLLDYEMLKEKEKRKR